jgi:hypothetical protein
MRGMFLCLDTVLYRGMSVEWMYETGRPRDIYISIVR